MARPPKSIQVITANRLIDGRVVFFTPDHGWDADVAAAAVFADPAAADGAMQRALQSAAAGEIVDPYAIAVSSDEGRVRPTVLRERIRAEGPTTVSEQDAA